ncbi:MAG: endo alpha-1,4 polygalactosaminidase [Ancrocorticia sp.]|uniref:endo alpha-1,4 polygalactosaminidase n=1 Tax=Ancrocorticia sp. TaxID=2593684 RepID=UPI003F9348A1
MKQHGGSSLGSARQLWCILAGGFALAWTLGACSPATDGAPSGGGRNSASVSTSPESAHVPEETSTEAEKASGSPQTDTDSSESWMLPEAGQLDYQLGGAYDPDDSVHILVRDREEPPLQGEYSICYVNAFQTQPGEESQWSEELLLKESGEVYYDPEWPDEALLDTSTEHNREQIVEIASPWIEQCARAGYQAVEFDNLDSYTRTDGLLSFGDNLAIAEELVEVAHANGLAAGQKNAAQDSAEFHAGAGFDFAITESCAYYGECAEYSQVYGPLVLDIEYADQVTSAEFQALCTEPESPAGMVLRDRDLLTPDDSAYVFETC